MPAPVSRARDGKPSGRRCDYCGRRARSDPSLAAHYIRRHWPKVRERQAGWGPGRGRGRAGLQERIGLLDTRIIPPPKPLSRAARPSVRIGVSTEAFEAGSTPEVVIGKQNKGVYPILLAPRTERKIIPKEMKIDEKLEQNQNSNMKEIEVITLSDDDDAAEGNIKTNMYKSPQYGSFQIVTDKETESAIPRISIDEEEEKYSDLETNVSWLHELFSLPVFS
jgi:hypothetical protein